jgi:hypothetical protein
VIGALEKGNAMMIYWHLQTFFLVNTYTVAKMHGNYKAFFISVRSVIL